MTIIGGVGADEISGGTGSDIFFLKLPMIMGILFRILTHQMTRLEFFH